MCKKQGALNKEKVPCSTHTCKAIHLQAEYTQMCVFVCLCMGARHSLAGINGLYSVLHATLNKKLVPNKALPLHPSACFSSFLSLPFSFSLSICSSFSFSFYNHCTQTTQQGCQSHCQRKRKKKKKSLEAPPSPSSVMVD